MAYTPRQMQLAEDINHAINRAKGRNTPKADITTVLSTISTAQAADTTTHTALIETPPAGMELHSPGRK